MSEYTFHPAAAIFPLLEIGELQQLADDIKKNGLRERIKLYDGQVLDGRNRYTACTMAGVEKQFEEVNPQDPVAYVISLNLHRRHLSESQRGMVAAKTLDYHKAEAKKRQQEAGGDRKSQAAKSVSPKRDEPISDHNDKRSSASAGKALNVSRTTVERAARVLQSGNEKVIQAVERGQIRVSTAEKLVSARTQDAAPTRMPTVKMPTSVATRVHAQLGELAKMLSKPSTQISIVGLRSKVKELIATVSKYAQPEEGESNV